MSKTVRHKMAKNKTMINKKVKRDLKKRRKKMFDVPSGNAYKKLADRWDHD